jgi:hypothetical protein
MYDQSIQFWKWVLDVKYLLIQWQDLGFDIKCELCLVDDIGSSLKKGMKLK